MHRPRVALPARPLAMLVAGICFGLLAVLSFADPRGLPFRQWRDSVESPDD